MTMDPRIVVGIDGSSRGDGALTFAVAVVPRGWRPRSQEPLRHIGCGYRYEIDLDFCKGCGLCAEECPCGAIEMEPEPI